MISIQWMPLRFSTSSTCKIGRCVRWCRKAWLPGPLSMAVSMCQSNNISAGLPITSWRSLGIEENKGKETKRATQQGEDKPSPLLWTPFGKLLHRRHSRGDGLSSPWDGAKLVYLLLDFLLKF